MLDSRNQLMRTYEEDRADELVDAVYAKYLPAFERLANTLANKIQEAKEEWTRDDA